MALFKKKKPVEAVEEEELDDLDDLDDLDEEDEEMEEPKKTKKKMKVNVEEKPEAPGNIDLPPTPIEVLKVNLRIAANRYYEITSQLNGKGKINEKSVLKYAGVKSKEELYREYCSVKYEIENIVKELIDDCGVKEKEIETLIKEAKQMNIEELI